MQKWKSEAVFRDQVASGDMDPDHIQLRMCMLGKLCGAVIGEGGKTIKEIMVATNTEIRVQVSLVY
jgi:KH domain